MTGQCDNAESENSTNYIPCITFFVVNCRDYQI